MASLIFFDRIYLGITGIPCYNTTGKGMENIYGTT